jgi:hypothetical protein
MGSLFDPIEDIEIPPEKPKRDTKKIMKIAGIVVGVLVLVGGGIAGYYLFWPRKLTERPIPRSPARLMAELQEARDGIDSQARDIYARIEQFNTRQNMRGQKLVSFSQVFLQGLSAEEEAALDKLVQEERDPSYRGVLRKVVEDMKAIRDLQTKVAELEALLPDDGVEVKRGDTHLKLARTWLMENHGLPETRARELAERLNIMDGNMRPGFRAHFYYDPAQEFFGSWVSQGEADTTPLAVVRARKLKLMQERDTAIARGDELEEKKAELEEILAGLQEDIDALEVRKATLETSVAQLGMEKDAALKQVETKTAELKVAQNSMYYEADLEGRLKARGVLRIRNKIEDIGNAEFKSYLDLSEQKSFILKPNQFGIDYISDVRVVPKFVREGHEIDLKFVEDGTVEVTVLDDEALKGQRVIFVVKQ